MASTIVRSPAAGTTWIIEVAESGEVEASVRCENRYSQVADLRIRADYCPREVGGGFLLACMWA
jgi:hypothetical protein